MIFRRHVSGVIPALVFITSKGAASPTVAHSPPRLSRIVAVATGVALGGTAGYFLGRHFARSSLCEGCSTSVNHDGYLGGGLAIGALVGGSVGWYVTRTHTAARFRVGRAGYLTNVEPTERSSDCSLRSLCLTRSQVSSRRWMATGIDLKPES